LHIEERVRDKREKEIAFVAATGFSGERALRIRPSREREKCGAVEQREGKVAAGGERLSDGGHWWKLFQ
jgi:hypothetical protein